MSRKIHSSSLAQGRNPWFERRYEILIFLFLVFKFLIMFPSRHVISPMTTTHYLFTYDFGFNPRSLIGTVIFFFTDYLKFDTFYIIAITAFLVLISLVSLLMGKVIHNSPNDVRSSVIILALLFLTSPISISCFLSAYFGLFDIYWLIFTLTALVCLKNKVLRWFVPFICFILMAVHNGYFTTYMPALIIPLLYEVYTNRYSKKSIAVFSLSCASILGLFLFFQFFSPGTSFKTAEEFTGFLSTRTDTVISSPVLHAIYFAPFLKLFKEYTIPFTLSYALPLGIALLIMNLPLLVVFGKTWKSCIHNTENKFLKFVFILCFLAPLAFIPAAIVGNDWDRWFAAVINSQFIIVFYFIFSGQDVVLNSVKRIGNFAKNHFLILFLVLIFLIMFTASKASHIFFELIDSSYYNNYFERYLENYTPITQTAFNILS